MTTEGCPPERTAAERSLIHIALRHGPDHVTPHLEARHFFDASRQHVLYAIVALRGRDEPTDLTTVMAELARAGRSTDHTRDELLACDETIAAPVNAPHYARTVREGYVRSESRRIGLALVEGAAPDQMPEITRELAALEEEGRSAASQVTLSEAAHAFTKLDPAHLRVPESLVGDGLVCRSDLALLSGRPRLGKSRVGLELGVACALGEPWLGLPTGKPARVGYVAAEFTAYRFLERCVQLFGDGWKPEGSQALIAAYDALGFSRNGGLFMPIPSDLPSDTLNLLDSGSARHLERFITDFALEMVILDPLGRLMGGQDETNEYLGKVVAALDRIRFRTGAALLVLHHERKESPDQRGTPDPLDAVRGGTKLTDFSNTVLRLKRGPGKLKVLEFPKANFARTPADLFLSIPEDGGRTVVEQAPEERADANRQRIAEWAAAQAGTFTARQAGEACGLTEKPARDHLKKLESQGVVSGSKGARGMTYWKHCDGRREYDGSGDASRLDV